MGSDGSQGVQAIKEHGGLTLAQAEFDATAMSGMPQSATSTGSVDYVLAVDAMAAKLADYKSHLGRVEPLKGSDGIRDDAHEHLTTITTLLRNRLKHDFSGYKTNTLVRRIQRRMQVLQIETVSAYVEHLRKEKDEAHALFRELLISVTRFFRDEEAFEALKRSALPSLLANKNSKDPLRVWVVGCATGEEVYSIAILLQEAMEANSAIHPVSIFGTDIDPDAIAFARAARYRKVDGLSAERLARWFVKDKDEYCPLRIIRDMCVFSEHSVVKDPPFSRLDLLSCRNVLIYLDQDRQQRVMQTFHYALRSGGYLFLGPSESVPRELRLFALIDKKHRILERQDDVRAVLPEFQRSASPHTVEPPPVTPRHEDRLEQSARRIMERHSPAFFVIDRNHDILRFSGGESAPYLEPSAGAANLHLFNILRKSLRSQVRTAIQKAFDKNQPVFDDNLAVRIDGKLCAVTLIVEPIADGALPGKLLIVAFRERGGLTETTEEARTARSEPDADKEALHHELRVAKAQAQASSNELENYIEEMKSMTEEYQSVTEELQSSNEELETSKEEMQSINEELQTINSEMQGKNEQLTQATVTCRTCSTARRSPPSSSMTTCESRISLQPRWSCFPCAEATAGAL